MISSTGLRVATARERTCRHVRDLGRTPIQGPTSEDELAPTRIAPPPNFPIKWRLYGGS
jgi:hypothetical protein